MTNLAEDADLVVIDGDNFLRADASFRIIGNLPVWVFLRSLGLGSAENGAPLVAAQPVG